jgi:hypothetical protein
MVQISVQYALPEFLIHFLLIRTVEKLSQLGDIAADSTTVRQGNGNNAGAVFRQSTFLYRASALNSLVEVFYGSHLS